MTPANGIEGRLRPVNWRNFHIAARLARESGISTAMITSKGEATLFPQQVTEYLDALQREGFPLIELQTNGIPLAEQPAKYDTHLRDWYQRNLSMIAISVVHHDPVRNRDIYLPHKQSYIDLPALLDTLHDVGGPAAIAPPVTSRAAAIAIAIRDRNAENTPCP